MTRSRDEAIEERISMEIIVDAYDEEEQTMGWFYYLEDTLSFPFKAKVINKRRNSPLAVREVVEVTGMGDEGDCHLDEMWVDIRFQDDILSVPLSQLKPVEADDITMQAVDDWHYWAARSNGG